VCARKEEVFVEGKEEEGKRSEEGMGKTAGTLSGIKSGMARGRGVSD